MLSPSTTYTLSDFEKMSLINTSGSENTFNGLRCPRELPCERSGTSMLDVAHAMQLDAASQVEVLEQLCHRLEEIVSINDQRQV